MKKKAKSRHARDRREPRGKPSLWKRLLAMILSPVLFLALVELVLTLAGYGYPRGFFIRWQAAGQTWYLPNEHYCEHFVPESLSRSPEPCALGRKDESTIRIFVLGGSAAWGDPDPAYGFCRQLGWLLNEHAAGKSFEVVNAAVTAMNSHVARRIAKDCVAREPDLFILFMGNNEVVGPYGPPTLPASLYSSRRFINACITVKKSTRIGSLVSKVGQAIRTGGKPQEKWKGMEAFLASRIALDDPKLQDCYRHLRDNLDDMIQTARRCGAGVILCTVPTNLQSCAPFGSQHEATLSVDETARWDQAFQEGRGLEKAGDFAGALAAYEKARQIDDTYADLVFCTGRCLQALGRGEEARRMLVEARDRDVLRFRADSAILRTIRETAQAWAAQGVRLLDLETYLDSRAGWAMPTDSLAAGTACPANFLVDHVHLDFRGNFLAASAAMRQVREMMPQAGLAEPSRSQEELLDLCRRRLLYDGHERYRLAMEMYRRRTVLPFSGQIGHDAEMEGLRDEIVQLRRAERDMKETEGGYRDVVERRPTDSYLILRHGQFLIGAGRLREARDLYQKAVDARPFDTKIRKELAQVLAQSMRKDEAVEVLMSKQSPNPFSRKDALLLLGAHCAMVGNYPQAMAIYDELNRIDPRNLDVLVNRAAAASHKEDLPAMKQALDKALKIAPNASLALINMGNYCAKQNQPKEARSWFARAVAAEPENPFAHVGLGIQSVRLEQMDKAVEHLMQAAALKPDFVEAYLLLAAIHDQAGRKDEAKKYMALATLFKTAPQ
ncbi:MAG: tetratricopeptide repeat protein [Sedimentisphaerales bacterium]|nr:tetratricopeptide repeat protein [Sedimentisphaerales bacterium]